MYKGVGARFAGLVSRRPSYFIFIGYLKTGDREGVRANPRTPSGSVTALEGELAKLRCGNFFF